MIQKKFARPKKAFTYSAEKTVSGYGRDFIMLRQLEQMESALIISNFRKLIHIDVCTPSSQSINLKFTKKHFKFMRICMQIGGSFRGIKLNISSSSKVNNHRLGVGGRIVSVIPTRSNFESSFRKSNFRQKSIFICVFRLSFPLTFCLRQKR